ncbi:MAG TPA: hypothetical protein VGG06_17470 [Thermoanaerobaculia bacterium]
MVGVVLSALFFGICVFVMEGYVEKLRSHVFALPLVPWLVLALAIWSGFHR